MTPARSGGTVVIGVGNEWRRDDGVGWVVARAIAQGCPAGSVELVLTDGEPARLLDAWEGAAVVLVVDAVQTGAAAGHVHVLSAADVLAGAAPADPAPGSHALGVAAALQLGAALDRLPGQLVVVGVEVADVGPGQGLSAPVAAAVARAAAAGVERLAATPHR